MKLIGSSGGKVLMLIFLAVGATACGDRSGRPEGDEPALPGEGGASLTAEPKRPPAEATVPIEPLLALVRDANADVGRRIEAAAQLGERRDPQAVDVLIELLSVRFTFLALEAEKALVKIGEPAVPALAAYLERVALTPRETDEQRSLHLDSEIRLPKMFAAIGSPSLEPLLKLLTHPDADARHMAADGLGSLGNSAAVEPLLGRLAKEADGWAMDQIIRALGSLGDARAVPTLLALYGDRGGERRLLAAKALAGIEDARVDAVLGEALERKDYPVLAAAHAHFIRRGIPGSEGVLIEALTKSGSSTVARVFMNCGHEPLAEAGRAWAEKWGYQILSLPGEAPSLRWGQRR